MVETKNQLQTQQQGKKLSKIELLKKNIYSDSVKEQFKNALGKNSDLFIASVIDLFNTDSKLSACEPNKIIMEALKAAVLKLPVSKALGYAFIVPYNTQVTVQDEHGNWKKVKMMIPQFQLGYKGYIQLAMRTGKYRTINADVVYEGELTCVSKLTGEISFDGQKKSDKIVGYFCYFSLTNGFSKTLYMTVEQMAHHAKKYSKGLVRYDERGNRLDVSIEELIELSNLPLLLDDNKTVGWLGNFHSMAIKTVIRILLSKWGYLSIEMQNAFENDAAAEYKSIQDGKILDDQDPMEQPMIDADALELNDDGVPMDVTNGSTPGEPDPGF